MLNLMPELDVFLDEVVFGLDVLEVLPDFRAEGVVV